MLAITVLTTLTRIDFDLIAPSIPLILPKLLLVCLSLFPVPAGYLTLV